MKIIDRIKEEVQNDVLSLDDINDIMASYQYTRIEDEDDESNILKYSNGKSQIWLKCIFDGDEYIVNDVTRCTKKRGKTEADPLYREEDIKAMMDYFRSNEKYTEFTIAMLEMLLARRIGDTVSLRWSDFYFDNGRKKDSLNTLVEEKTDKIIDIAITKAVYEHWNLDKARNACYLWDAVRSEKDVIYKERKQKYFFFCAAMLSDAKGAAFAIEAFGRSNLAKDGYKLVLAGNITENYKNTLEGIMKTYDITKDVELIGYCNNIKPYMAEATAFLMCSKNEGLGRVTIEAMFYGCPVIARNTGGTSEIINNKENGILFTDIASCIEAMNNITHNSYKEMILEAQHFAILYFSEEKYGKRINRMYRSILNN